MSDGIIEPSDSPYCNPLRILVKKDNTVSICLDARFVNEIVESDHESPPLIQELMQKFHGAQHMSTSDMANGYWQIPLDEESRKYTAFLYDSKLYHFCRVPFGLKTAGSAFIRALNQVLGDAFSDVLTLYVDDILITTSGTVLEHFQAIGLVYRALQDRNFTLKLEKSIFCRRSVDYLGFVLSVDGIRPNPDKLEVIRNFPEPRNRTELQQFIGICTYYRQFSVKHSNVLDPFRNLLRKNTPWMWTEKHGKSFEILKQNFIDCITLKHVDPNAQFRLQTNASNEGVSGVLYQLDREENPRVISLVSRCLNQAEVNYTTTEKELLAIVYSVMKLRTYLIGHRYLIVTDHKGLTFLNSTVYLNARLIRWTIILQQYDFEVSYCRGSDNVVADFFSRDPRGCFEEIKSDHLSIDVLVVEPVEDLIEWSCCEVDLGKDLRKDLKNLSTMQELDPFIRKIIDNIDLPKYKQHYLLEAGVLFHIPGSSNVCQVVIPFNLTQKIVDCIHTGLGHPGVYKTLTYLKEFYFWKKMNKDVRKFILSCDLCQRTKTRNVKMEGEFHLV